MLEAAFLRILQQVVEDEDLVVAFELKSDETKIPGLETAKFLCTISGDDPRPDQPSIEVVGGGSDLGVALADAYDKVRPRLVEARS